MSSREREQIPVAPPRLAEESDRIGELLKNAQRFQPPGRAPAFATLMARRSRVRRLPGGLILALAGAPLVFAWWAERESPTPGIAAEQWMPAELLAEPVLPPSAPPELAARDVEATSPLVEPSVLEAVSRAPAVDEGTGDEARARGPGKHRASSVASGSSTSSGASASSLKASATDAERCADWTGRGDYKAAVACYERKAEGNGVAAEWALLEKARLQSRALGQPAEALRALDEYDERFPSGALVREARLSRIEILISSGRPAEALKLLDDTLGRDRIPERRGELLLLRAQLRADGGRCAEALEDLEGALAAGIAPARARALREKCSP